MTSSFLPMIGGAEIVVHNLATALTELGHEVTVVAPRYSKALRNHVRYRLHHTLPGMLTLFGTWERAAQVYFGAMVASLRRHRFDVVNAHFALPLGYALVRRRESLRIPVVITFHGTDIQTMPSIAYGLRMNHDLSERIRHVASKADALVAISESVHVAILELQARPQQIFRIPNGVDVSRLRTVVRRGAFRQRFNLTTDHKVILAVGRNHPKKGFPFLVRAMAIVKASVPEARCVIVGRNTEVLADEAEALGLRGNLFIAGESTRWDTGAKEFHFPDQAMVEAYQESDIFVSSSIVESFSLASLEAMAAGLPVVATDAPGHRDLIVDGHNGLLCRAGDPKDLAEKIMRMLQDHSLRRGLSTNASRTAQMYDWREIGSRYAEAFRNLVPSESGAP